MKSVQLTLKLDEIRRGADEINRTKDFGLTMYAYVKTRSIELPIDLRKYFPNLPKMSDKPKPLVVR